MFQEALVLHQSGSIINNRHMTNRGGSGWKSSGKSKGNLERGLEGNLGGSRKGNSSFTANMCLASKPKKNNRIYPFIYQKNLQGLMQNISQQTSMFKEP